MRAIFINSKERKVEEIDFNGDFREIQKQLDVDCFTCVGIDDDNTLYVDDEGLMNGTQDFFDMGLHQPFAGNGLILGTDEMGESSDATMEVPEVRFLDMLQVMLQSKLGAY